MHTVTAIFTDHVILECLRDLEEVTYYASHGGQVPVKWTAPEVTYTISGLLTEYDVLCRLCTSRSTPQQ